MRKMVLFAVAVVMAGCGRHGGLRASNTNPTTTGDAAAAGTGGMGASGNAGASGAAAGSGTNIAGSTATGSGAVDAATGGGGAASTGDSSGSSGGTVARTTGSGGIASSGGRVEASAGQSGGSSGTSGGGSALGGSTGGSGGQNGGSSGAGGGGVAGNGEASGSGGATGSCTGCQSLEQCWDGQLCVAQSVSVPAGFAIDATEVTRGQYAAWLATNPATTGQATVCSWNASFTPDVTCMGRVSVCQGTACAQHPQPCVDMCDAAAYCTGVGKRLCGAIGGGSVSSVTPDMSLNIATKSQWYNACTSSGVNQFTYGNSAVWGNCNDYLSFSTTTVPVASMPECQSPIPGYAGIFDLIGNVSEWEDNCNGSAGQADRCKLRGFSFGAGELMPMCSQFTSAYRDATYATIGFRCCIP